MANKAQQVTVNSFRDSQGNFSMLAVDQRESLRNMLGRASPGRPIADSELVNFKVQACEALTPYASGVLVDRLYGLPAARVAKCPLILAADVLHSDVAGGPVTRAEVDHEVTAAVVDEFGATALKMLVAWLPDARGEATGLAQEFMDLCRRLEIVGIVEGVVRPAYFDTWCDADKNDALVQAAQDLATSKPDLYKAEVPLFGAGTTTDIITTAQRITDSVDCPWVVLSSGVDANAFPRAVELSMAGGASGFLAGRAVWADATSSADSGDFLRSQSAARLQQLADGLPNHNSDVR